MSDFSTNLQLPYLMPAQAQKHVTVNEALRRMDVLVQMSVQSRTTAAQPASPGDGQLWILPPDKTGADWNGFSAGRIAYYRDGAWEEITPRPGWFAFVIDANQLEVFTGAAWVSAADAAGALLEGECASPASVKAIDQGLATGSVVRFTGLGLGASPSADLLRVEDTANQVTARIWNRHAGLTSAVVRLLTNRLASGAFGFLEMYTAASAIADLEFYFRGDGNAYADGAWAGGGADYAEYFEWADGNPHDEDRRGLPVVLTAGGTIRPATMADDPAAIIGAISATPTVAGDAAWNKWDGKYLRDDFGAYLWEQYEPAEAGEAAEEGESIPVQRRRVLNPAFDPARTYVPRAARREWAPVGLMGKLRVRKGQPVGERWVRLREISGAVEEWLVR